jgi:hypothetical protein
MVASGSRATCTDSSKGLRVNVSTQNLVVYTYTAPSTHWYKQCLYLYWQRTGQAPGCETRAVQVCGADGYAWAVQVVLCFNLIKGAVLCCAMLCVHRLGIFVSGRLACIGHPKDITSRFCGFLVSHGTLASTVNSHAASVPAHRLACRLPQ